MADFRERQLARQHDARKTERLHGLRACEVVDRHLRAGMERQVRRAFPREFRDAEVLHERRVRADALEELQVVAHRVEFVV